MHTAFFAYLRSSFVFPRLIKTVKSDLSGGFSSDAFLNGSDLLFENIAGAYMEQSLPA